LDVSQLPRQHLCHQIQLPEDCLDFVPLELLPEDWREANSASAMEFGTTWVEQGVSAAIAVPSAIAPRESNYLLNSAHPDFVHLSVVDSWPLEIDRRLIVARAGAVKTNAGAVGIADLEDRLLRIRADFENYRRRAERERLDLFTSVGYEIVGRLLPVLDNFDRAVAAQTQDHAYTTGVSLIHKQFMEELKGVGLNPISTVGGRYDSTRHSAVEFVESDEAENHQILEELQKGYEFKDNVLRPASVRVAVKPSMPQQT
jgi:molecular chaperone GrpE